MAISISTCKTLELIRSEWLDDPKIQDVIKKLKEDPTSIPNYSWDLIGLRYKGRIVLAPNCSYHNMILKEFHSSPATGHFGFFRTYKRIYLPFYRKGTKKIIKKFVVEYDVCQCHKGEIVATSGLLQPLPIPDDAWTDISMDFIDGLPPS